MTRCGYGFLLTVSLLLPHASASELPPPEDTQPVTFRAQYMPSPSRTDINAIAARRVLKQFLDEHPNYNIEPFVMPEVGGASAMDSGPLMAISAGVPPHAIYVNFRQSSTYLEQGFLEPLEVLLARLLSDNPAVRRGDADGQWEADPSPATIQHALDLLRARVPGPVWPVVYREDESGQTGEKHVWAIPTGMLVKALLYRKDLFNEAGLDPDDPPSTWEELYTYARRLRDPERKQYGMLFMPGHATSYQAYNFFVANGARAVVRGSNGVWRAAYDTQAAAEAIYFFWRLIRQPVEINGEMVEGVAGFEGGDRWIKWERGQVGMSFGYLNADMLQTINPQLVGIAPCPAAPRGRGSELNATMLGVFSGGTIRQKLAVMRFIWFFTGDEAKRIRTQAFVENGYGTFVNPDLLERYGYDRLLKRVPQGWRDTFEQALENGVPEPYGRNTQNIYRWMSEPINRAILMPLHDLPEEEAIATIRELLEDSVQETNRKVMGLIPADEMRHRRLLGGIIILLVALAFAGGIVHVWRYFTHQAPQSSKSKHIGRYTWGYLLLLPGLALVLFWMYLPLFAGGISLAFMDYKIVLDSAFVGVDNFANMLFDEKFWSGLARTIYFVALTIGLGFWPPILLAILLQEVPTTTAKYTYRTLFYLPAVLIGVVVMFLWKQLYEPTPQGVLNQIILGFNNLGPISATLVRWLFITIWGSFIAFLYYLPIRVNEMGRIFKVLVWALAVMLTWVTLRPFIEAGTVDGDFRFFTAMASLFGAFHFEYLRWLQDPDLAMACIVIPHVWASAGPGCIIYLAALKSVPEELYEAADIDGASSWHKVFYIVLPRLKYLIMIQFVFALIGAFKGGAEFILIMTGGGPAGATTTLSLEIFFRTFMSLNFGEGTAMAWVLGAILIGFTAWQLKILSRSEFTTAK